MLLNFVAAVKILHACTGDSVHVNSQLVKLCQLAPRQVEILRLVIARIVRIGIQLLEEEHFGNEASLNALLNHAWPVVSHELHLCIVVLDPLCLRCDLFLQLAVLLLQALSHDADQVLDFDQNASEESHVMPAFREANHSTEHVLLAQLLVRIVQLSYVEFLGDRNQSFENADTFRLKAPA